MKAMDEEATDREELGFNLECVKVLIGVKKEEAAVEKAMEDELVD